MSDTDIAAKDEVVADATAAESAPVETASPAATDPLADDAFDDIDDEVNAETDDEAEQAPTDEPAVEETPADNQPQGDTPKSPEEEFNQMAGKSQEKWRSTINERNELRRQVEELKAKQAQLATEQDLMNEINPETGMEYTPQEIERISWQQGREAQAERVNQELYETQIRENQYVINEEAGRVSKDFPLLDPDSADFVPEIGQQYAEALSDSLVYVLPDGQQANRTTLLANGINPDAQATLVGYNTSPYKLAKLAADAFNRAKAQGETIGQAKAQKATEQMLANADAPSGSSQAGSSDSELSDFDKTWDE